MKAAESTWSPFQSPEVREICAHLTAAERQQLVARAARFGQETVWRVAVPVAATEFAQARGYRSDAIRMFALPWTR